MKKLLLLFLLSAFSFSLRATDRIAASAQLGDVQSAVNAAVDGDRVLIPNGSATWSGGITTTKQIKIEAQSYTATPGGMAGTAATSRSVVITKTGNSDAFHFTSGNSYHVGIAGLDMLDSAGDGALIYFQGSGSKVPTINDCVIRLPRNRNIDNAGTQHQTVSFHSLGGIMWNCYGVGTGTGNQGGVGPSEAGMLIESPRAWDTTSTLGALDSAGTVNVYIEDCTFKNLSQWPDLDVAGRAVIRYCRLDGTWSVTHAFSSGNNGLNSGRHIEYYNNVFETTQSQASGGRNMAGRYVWIRGGTGIFTDNSAVSAVDTSTWNQGSVAQLNLGDNQSAPGYPNAGIPGWGHNGSTIVLDPIYLWNQTGNQGYSVWWQSGWSSLVQQNREVYINNGAKPGYQKYTYPHPLRSGSGTPDTTPPSIISTNISNIGATSLQVNWGTDESTTNALDFGTSVSYGTTAIFSTYNSTFSTNITGLSASTTYYFRVRAGDSAGNKSTNTFSGATIAADSTPPSFSAGSTNIINITSSGATIQGSVTESSYSGVTWGYTTATTNASATNGVATSLTPSVAFSGATASTLVYVRFWVSDTSGNTNAVLASFTTLPAAVGGRTFYVDQTAGVDSNNGTSPSTPWKNCPGMKGTSVYTGNGTLLPGDTVYFDRGDTWLVSGAGVEQPGFTLAPGVKYVGDSWGTGTRATVQANGRCYAGIVRLWQDDVIQPTWFQSVRVNGAATNTATGIDVNHGYWNAGMTGALKCITNCVVEGLYADSGAGDYCYGIIVSDNSPDASGWVANVTIENNIVTGSARDFVCLYPGSSGMISNVVVRGNYVSGASTDPSYSEGHGILAKGNVKNCTIEFNTVTNMDSSAIFIDGPEQGTGMGPTNLVVRHNILQTYDNNGTIRFYSLNAASISQADIYGNIILTNSTTGGLNFDGVAGTAIAKVYNNTFWGTFVSIGNPATATIHFTNNIIASVSATPFTDANTKVGAHGQNTYFRGGSGTTLASVGGSSYTSGNLTTYEPSGLSSNPLFANTNSLPTGFTGAYGSTITPNTSGLSLQAGSPSINSGATLPATYNRSINSLTRAAPWDRGAYETADTPPAISGTNVTNIAFDRAVAVATTSELAYGGVAWGYNTSVTNGFSTNATTLNTSHSLLFTGTTASTLIYMKWFFTGVSGLTTNALMSYTSAAAPASTPIPPPIGVRVTPSAP